MDFVIYTEMENKEEEIKKSILLKIIKNSFFGNYNPYSAEVLKIKNNDGDKFAVDWACSGQTEREGTK